MTCDGALHALARATHRRTPADQGAALHEARDLLTAAVTELLLAGAPQTWAPTYVVAHDLSLAFGRERMLAHPVGPRAHGRALDLLEAVSEALTFPEGRAGRLLDADRTVVRLRMLLRLMEADGVISAGHASGLHDQISEVGRMIGGWRRALRRTERAGDPESAHPQAGGSSAAVPSTTTPTGAVRRTATTGGPRGATTTMASASAFPLPPAAEPTET